MTSERRRDRGRPTSAAIVVLVTLLFTMEVYLVTRPVDGLPQTPVKTNTFLTDALAKGHRVSQTMKIGTGGFDEILLRASAVGDTHVGEMVLLLYEIKTIAIEGEERFLGEEQLLYRDFIPVRTAVSKPTFTFKFPAINESAGRWYRLEIRMATGNSPGEVELWATPGRWSGGGSLFINEQSGYAELVFKARASERATVWASLWNRFGGVGVIALMLLLTFMHLAFVMILLVLMTFPRVSTHRPALLLGDDGRIGG